VPHGGHQLERELLVLVYPTLVMEWRESCGEFRSWPFVVQKAIALVCHSAVPSLSLRSLRSLRSLAAPGHFPRMHGVAGERAH